jgi:2-oxoglutarate dehydrogenase E2 component (dihydrolipoamide succinyltransferase)
MGESIFEGTITKWLKKAGEAVEKDEPLFEISTDKVDAEIPSPVSGVLSEIRFPEGSTVQINVVVAVIGTSGAGSSAVGASAPAVAVVTKESSVEKAGRRQNPPQAELAPPEGSQVANGINVVMPQLGESIVEGTITKWLKNIGDTVEKDELLFEISTDKVDAEIPSPVAGVLSEIKVPTGSTVGINTVVAVIDTCGVASDGFGASAPVAAVATAESQAPPQVGSEGTEPTRATREQLAPPQVVVEGRKIRSSPLVRRIAKENHLDLARLVGSGLAGRITKDDILRYLNANGPGSTAQQTQLAAPQVSQSAPPQVVPLTKMRAIIAQRMLESVQTSPHAHTVYKVDMTRIARLRERQKARYEQQHGVKLTYMPFIATAAVEALGKFPIVNASLEGNAIRYHRNIHLGIAVALEWGLIVPVIKQAEERSFLGLARAIADLAARARVKKLMPDEVGGSTFTLTNSGVFGGEFGTPIINQPESAILAIGGLRKEPAVVTDSEGNDSIAIRSMQYFCLGFDHRTIDGAESGKFMSLFKQILEGWEKEIG